MAIPMAWQIGNIAGWVAQQIANIFDNIGQVQDGMRSIAVPRQMPDEPGAVELPRAIGAVRFENVHFDYGRSRAARRRAARARPRRRAGRAGRPRRPLRRRQVDAGASAARVLPAGAGPHPHRRPRHRRAHPGEPASADRHGDAGHLAAAPLDPRQHPLRPARGQRSGDRATRRGARTRPSSSRGSRTGTAARRSTPMSASAGSNCRAASASASRSPG